MPVNSSILKLKQKLKAWNWVPEGFSPKQRRLVWIAAGGVCVLLVYVALVMPLMALQNHWDQELVKKRQLLQRYQSLTENAALINKSNQNLKNILSQTETQLLSGANPAVAAADLQEILKNLTSAHGVQLTSTKIMPPREAGPYVEVAVQVTLSGAIDQLVTILYQLEHHKKLLYIPDLEINAPRWAVRGKEAGLMQINLVVSGLMKKGTGS